MQIDNRPIFYLNEHIAFKLIECRKSEREREKTETDQDDEKERKST